MSAELHRDWVLLTDDGVETIDVIISDELLTEDSS